VPTPYLEVDKVSKSLGGVQILDEINFKASKGDLIGLLGPSGSGKTTLLNIIGGFLSPDSGTLHLDGAEISNVPPYRRDIGITFQRYALFPHLSVFDNIAYGLKRRQVPGSELRDRVEGMLRLFGLERLATRFPQSLSGGEQQRTAFARALVVRPRLMLLDEPLANLDASLRQRVRFEIREILRENQVTSIFVTHDQEEAFALCDQVAVLYRGRIEQLGTPAELIESPSTAFVAGFLGSPNVLSAKVVDFDPGSMRVRFAAGNFVASACARASLSPGSSIEVFIRPEQIQIQTEKTDGMFRLKDWVYVGGYRDVWLDGPIALRCRVVDARLRLERGSAVAPIWNADAAFAFPANDPEPREPHASARQHGFASSLT
jgi:ABC-type Fe3+/spermidine/putrescine transport system ATPase subunit